MNLKIQPSLLPPDYADDFYGDEIDTEYREYNNCVTCKSFDVNKCILRFSLGIRPVLKCNEWRKRNG